MTAFSATEPDETFDHVRAQRGPGPAAGPFTPAPPGLVAELGDESQPILFFDRYGRPVLLDNGRPRNVSWRVSRSASVEARVTTSTER